MRVLLVPRVSRELLAPRLTRRGTIAPVVLPLYHLCLCLPGLRLLFGRQDPEHFGVNPGVRDREI